MTVDQLLDKVSQRLDPDDRSSEYILEQACWFVSYQAALHFSDTHSLKDMARSFRDGAAPGPFKTRGHILDWLEETDDGSWENGTFEEWVDEQMRQFFGR